VVRDVALQKVVPRLLLPLQAGGRILKPRLIHGDCWDGNTPTDAKTGETFVFDVCSFYGRNEYDIGNWRAPHLRLSRKAYIENYKANFPVSKPALSINVQPRQHNLYSWITAAPGHVRRYEYAVPTLLPRRSGSGDGQARERPVQGSFDD
jgi:fructosamine-3-kinase